MILYGEYMIDLVKSAIINNIEPINLYNWFRIYPNSNKRVVCYCEECGIERNISYRQYHVLCRKCANNDSLKIKKRKAGFNEYYSHQENRNIQGKKIIQYYIDHPEARKNVSVKMIEYYSHQENRDANSKRRTEYYSHQENRDSQAERTRQYAKDHPETSEMLIERSKRISAGRQGVSYDEWKSFTYNLNSLYCPAFDEDCRESNREKYDRRCFTCDLLEEENVTKNGDRWKLSVHHYDMDKMQGCDGKKWKLVPLCLKCHGIAHNSLWEARITWLLENVWRT